MYVLFMSMLEWNIKGWNNTLLASKHKCYNIKQKWKQHNVFVHVPQGNVQVSLILSKSK